MDTETRGYPEGTPALPLPPPRLPSANGAETAPPEAFYADQPTATADEPEWLALERSEAFRYEALALDVAPSTNGASAAVVELGPGPDEADDDGADWYTPVDMRAVLAGDVTQPLPDVLAMADGRGCLFYRGLVNGLHGDSGTGKTWVAQLTVAQELKAGRRAVVIDLESNRAEWAGRLLALDVDPEAIAERLVYVSPSTPAMPRGRHPERPHESILRLVALIRRLGNVGVVVIDSTGEAFGVEGIDENSDAEVGPWNRWVLRPLADAGPGVLTVDHATKAADSPLHPSGSKRKRAAITGASYLVTSSTPPTKDRPGFIDLTCAKDRHGNYRRDEKVATLALSPGGDGRVVAVLTRCEPEEQKSGAGERVLDRMAAAATRILKDAGRPMTQNELEAALGEAGFKAGHDAKRGAIDRAYGTASIDIATDGPRGAKLHAFVADFDPDRKRET